VCYVIDTKGISVSAPYTYPLLSEGLMMGCPRAASMSPRQAFCAYVTANVIS
jgi:hypothetical protein